MKIGGTFAPMGGIHPTHPTQLAIRHNSSFVDEVAPELIASFAEEYDYSSSYDEAENSRDTTFVRPHPSHPSKHGLGIASGVTSARHTRIHKWNPSCRRYRKGNESREIFTLKACFDLCGEQPRPVLCDVTLATITSLQSVFP